MKKLSRVILSAVILCNVISINVCAKENQTQESTELATGMSGYYTYTVSNGNVMITGCDSNASGAVTIPASINGYPVTTIAYGAFYLCDNMTSVTLPYTVKSIEDNAFMFCDKLTNIIVDTNNPNYTSVDGVLFNKNKTLLIRYPEGKTNQSYAIPDSVLSVGADSFRSCKRINGISIPNSVTSIEEYAFSDCEKMAEIILSNSITKIGAHAFVNCNSLKSIKIPNGISRINNGMFAGCENLTSVSVPDNVTSIGEYAFAGCTKLSSITIPKKLVSIGEYAFWECNSLKRVIIPNSVKNIGNQAFGNISDDFDPYAKKRVAGFTIYGYIGTAAEKYAKANKLTFKGICYIQGQHTYNIYNKCSKCGVCAPGVSTLVSSVKVKSISRGKTYLKVKWAKNSKVKGYQIRYSTISNMNGSKTTKITKYTITSKKIKSLKTKTTYYIQIRAYKTINGKTMYSPWSAVKSAKTK